MKKIEIDFSDKIKASKVLCDCEEGVEEFIPTRIWAKEKNEVKKLNKPFRTSGGPKKFSVYVKNDKGNVVKVNFGDPNMEIKRDDPARRKSFRARHNCDNPGPKYKARYWSCKQWRAGTKVQGSEIELNDKEIEEIILDEIDETAARQGLWDNIHKKRKRIKNGSGEKMRKKGDKGAPTQKQIKQAQKPKKKAEAEEDAGYPPNCKKGYEEKDGKCVPVAESSWKKKKKY